MEPIYGKYTIQYDYFGSKIKQYKDRGKISRIGKILKILNNKLKQRRIICQHG